MNIDTQVQQDSYQAAKDGTGGQLRLNRRGELVTSDFVMQAALDGRLYSASAGLLTGPLTWTATATIDGTKPALFLAVPSGTTVIPVSIALYMEAFGSSAQFECAAMVGTGGVSAGGTAVTITNMRTDAPHTSACTCTSDITGGTYLTTNISTFWRDGEQFCITKTAGSATAAADDPHRYIWRLSDGESAPVCEGASQLLVCQGSQAGTGFITLTFIEIPTVHVT